MAEAAGALAVRIGADVTDLVAGFRKAEKETEIFSKSISRVGLVVTAAASALALIVKSSADAADELGKLSQKTGVSVEALSALKYAGQLADVSLDALATGLKKLAKNMVDAQSGTGEATQAFAALGISVTDANGKLRSSEDVFNDIADSFEGMKDGAGKTALAMALFGKSGADLIPMLNAGSKGLKEMGDEAKRLGVIISTETAKQAEEFNDNLTRLKIATEGWKHAVANSLIPSLIELQNQLIEGTRIFGGFWEMVYQTGTINPFRSVGGNIKEITADLEALEKGLEKRKARGWDTSGFEARIDNAKKRLQFLRLMQTQEEQSAPGAREHDAAQRAFFDPGAGGKEKKDAPVLVDPKEAEKRAKEIADIRHKVREDEDARELKQIEFTNKQAEELEKDRLVQEAQIRAIAHKVREDEDARDLKRIAEHQEKLQALREEFNPEQAEIDAYDARLARLREFSDAELEAIGGRLAAEQKMQGEHVVKLAQIRNAGDQRIFKMVNSAREGDLASSLGYFSDMTAGLAQHNKKMFELNKAAATASAIVNAFKGIALSLSEYAWPWNLIAGAAHAAVAFAQVQAIQSQTFAGGGSGSAPSLAGSTGGAPAVSDVSGGGGMGRQSTTINLHGETFGREQVRGLMERINEEGRDGGRIVIIDRP